MHYRNCTFGNAEQGARESSGKRGERKSENLALGIKHKSSPHSKQKRRSTKKSRGHVNLDYLFVASLSLSLSHVMAAAAWRGALSRNLQELR